MGADVVADLTDRRGDRGIAFERQGAGEDRGAKSALSEEAEEPPNADAAAILEHRLGGEIPAGKAAGAAFGEAGFRCGIAIGYRGLRTFLVVDADVEREPR